VIDGKNPQMVNIVRSLTNEAYKGVIELVKTETGTTTPVEGAVFELYRMSDTVGGVDQKINNPSDVENGYYTTDSDGTIRVENLSWGTYYFKEISAPAGYIQPTPATCKTDSVTITAENVRQSIEVPLAITFSNTKVLGNVELRKVDHDDNEKALEGAVFTLYRTMTDEDGQTQMIEPAIQTGLTTDEDGKLFCRDLPYGSYAFVETSAPKGYQLDVTPVNFRIGENDNGKTVALTFTNSLIRAGVQFTKRDAQDDTLALNGAVFGLYQAAEIEGESDQYLGDITSQNVDGQDGIVRKDGLGAGNYYFAEKQAPTGYQTDSERRITFTIAAGDNGSIQNLDSIYTVTNQKQDGELYLIKYAEDRTKRLNGARFDLYRVSETEENDDERILNPEAEDGAYVTDEDGRITVGGLAWGTYYFREIAAPLGYGINETAENQRLTLNAETVSAEAAVRTAEVTDDAIRVKINKIDKDTEESLSGALLALYDAEDVDMENGEIRSDAQPLASWTSEADQPKEIGTLLEAGRSYAVVELEAPEDYEIALPVRFTVNADGTLEDETEDHTVLIKDIRIEPTSAGENPPGENPPGENPPSENPPSENPSESPKPSGGGSTSGGGSGSSRSSGNDSDATATILDTEVPLAALPNDMASTDSLITILDEMVPLSALPKMGDRSQTALLAVIAAISAGLAAYFVTKLKKESDKEE
jgi:uncharacterized surface anchored protein